MVRFAVVLAGTVIVTGGTLLVPNAPAHAPFPKCPKSPTNAPVGSPKRVYRIPHGCVSLKMPGADGGLPTVVVRRHNARGRWSVHTFRAPDTNLDRARGSLGVCAHADTAFIVRWPYVTIIASELYQAGSRRACTDIDLSWTLVFHRGLKASWSATREPL